MDIKQHLILKDVIISKLTNFAFILRKKFLEKEFCLKMCCATSQLLWANRANEKVMFIITFDGGAL